MPGSPVGPFVGSSWRQQTMLHVERFNMSDRVALNGRSTCNERTCDRNTREPVLNRAQARLAPNCPYLNRDTCVNVPARAPASRSRITTKLPIKLYNFKHNNTNTWAKTVPGINSNRISPTARTTGRTTPSCQILHGWYTSQPTRQSCISGKRGIV